MLHCRAPRLIAARATSVTQAVTERPPPMSPYPDQANNDLLERIPLSAGVVLDVGCHTGALGAAYRRLNPRALLLGIESDPVSAETAARRLDQVAVVDVEQD